MHAAVEPETVRNMLLRRADWRVLLANPQPKRAVCFADGALLRAVELFADLVVAPEDARSGDCDLAVALDPDERTLAAAAAALRPGGSLYVEWWSVRGGWFRRMRRSVEAAGFDGVLPYWPWPPPSRGTPTFWLPLEARGAQRYLATRNRSASLPREALHAARRGVWRAANRSGFALPVCVVATRSGLAPVGSSRPLEALFAPTENRAAASGRSLLLLTGGPRSVSKIVGLVFDEPDPRPRVALKLPRTAEAAALLHHEARVLRALAASAPDVPGVPRVEYERDHGGLPAVAETFLSGTPLYELARPRTYRSAALQATAWIASLAGRPAPSPQEAWWDRLVAPILADFRANFGDVVDPAAVDAAEALVATLPALPLVCEHRDYAPWNVFRAPNGELAVLDWEGAELRGLPGLDLLYFLAYHSFFHHGALTSGRYRAALRACFDPSTLTGRVTFECLDAYGSRVGLDSSCWPALRVLVWMLKTRSEHQRFAEDAAGAPSAAALRTSLFLGLWEEELKRLAGSR